MSWRFEAFLVHRDLCVEVLGLPAVLEELTVNPRRHLGLPAAAHTDPRVLQPETVQNITDLGVLLREVLPQDRERMTPFMHLVVFEDETGQLLDLHCRS